ncbi:MAG TPA: cytochrome c biogenesis protein CcdA [Vicinamibacterales bacterium]|nr:cytochrome c biogenesis protein CcdA [Vicinamibacterales bacterium]
MRRLLSALVIAAALAAVVPNVSAQPGPPLTAKLTPLTETNALRAGASVRLAMRVELSPELHVQANVPSDPGFIATVLTVDPPAGVTVDELVYPVATDLKQFGIDEPLKVYGHDFVIGVRVTLAPTVEPGTVVIGARLRYQACNDKVCFRPITATEPWVVQVVPKNAVVAPQHPDVFKALAFGRGIKPPPHSEEESAPAAAAAAQTSGDGLMGLDRFKVQLTAGGYLNEAEFLKFISDAESGTAPQGLFEGRGPLAILLLVIAGGLALNLTPCVLPMIPINLAIIGAGSRAGSRQRGFLLGASYGAAMAVVYGVLGLVVILTAGTFGTINASPWFNAGIAALFVVLGLAMFDVLVIDFSRFSTAFKPDATRQGSVALAFTMGGVAALLAGACVAPVVIQVVLFASDMYAGGNHVALALPFALGLGMALPWPLAGAGMAALPKPGLWMVRVKQVFGVLILAMAVYYGYLGYTIFDNRRVGAGEVSSSVAEMLASGWHASLPAGLAAAEREGKPVLLDLWATWCKNCLTMDKTTLKTAGVTKALDPYVKIKVQAEDPDEPATKALMKHLGAVGLPAYAILKPR